MTTAKLTVELVPSTQWGANLRKVLPKKEWDRLRKAQYQKADYKCEICGGKGYRHPVECHESWEYDDTQKTQRLVGLIALCPSCHEVKHLGRTINMGFENRALSHLTRVNGWTLEVALRYIDLVFSVWKTRSRFQWTLDLSWLENPKETEVYEDPGLADLGEIF